MKNKEQIFKILDSKFIPLGFTRIEDDPQFHYEWKLISEEEIDINDLEDDEVQALVYGDTGINKGFALYDGKGSFVWTSISFPKDAIEWASKIVAFED